MVVSISHRELAAISAKIKTTDLPIKILSTSSYGLKERFRRGLKTMSFSHIQYTLIFFFFFFRENTFL